ncbi:MAG: chemotaxis protein, partial [Rhizobacter sp.]|nr:chemotaxis protein [Rhizobacter sp.]
MIISNLKLRSKLGLSFFSVVLLTAAVGAFAVAQLSRINDSTQAIAGDWMPSIQAIEAIRSLANDNRRAEAQHVLASNADDMRRHELRLQADKSKLSQALAVYEPLVSSAEERMLADQLKQQVAAYQATTDKLVSLSADPAKERETRDYFSNESRLALVAVLATGDRLSEINVAGAKVAHASANETYASSRTWLISLVLAAMAVASLMAMWITRLITRPVAQAVDAANRIAAGDLTVEFDRQGRDEIAQLLQALATMQGNLSGIVGEVRENAEGVATASAQIAQGNNDLSGRTEEQASALEETAASMEQLSSTVRQNADNAREANGLAQGASTVAVRGGDMVKEVVETMKGINASSKKITDIIAVIDGI